MSITKLLIAFGAGAVALLTPMNSSAATNEECSEDILMSYYPEEFVTQTLEKFQVPQAQRMAIIKALAAKDHEVVPTVEDRAAKMTPNPLRDPKYRQEAVKIFRDTLYELFANVMQAHGVNNREQIQAMLDDVQQQKAERFAACLNQESSSGSRDPSSPKGEGRSPLKRGVNSDYSSPEPQTDYNQDY